MAATTSAHTRSIQRKSVRWLDIQESITGCLFILPAFIIIGLFGLFPIGFAVYVSLHKWRINPNRFAGLENYEKALDNLAYVIFFWVAAILLFLAVRSLIRIRKTAQERGDNPWPWLVPAFVTAVGIVYFIWFFVLLLPEVLNIAEKIKGQTRTRELFVQYLVEAWRMPAVQSALRTSLLIILAGLVLAYLIYRYVSHNTHSTTYYSSLLSVLLLIGGAIVLSWFTWSEIQRAYAEALEAGEPLEVWAQVITISAGFLLLLLSWLSWRGASRQSSTLVMILRIAAGILLVIAAWILIAELPRVVAAGDEDWWQGLKVTAYYSLGTVPFQLGISLFLAALLFQNIRGRSAYRLI